MVKSMITFNGNKNNENKNLSITDLLDSGASQRIRNIKIIAGIAIILIGLLFTPIPYIGALAVGIGIALKIAIPLIADILIFVLALIAIKRASSSRKVPPPPPPINNQSKLQRLQQPLNDTRNLNLNNPQPKNNQLNKPLSLEPLNPRREPLNLRSIDKSFYERFSKYRIKQTDWLGGPNSKSPVSKSPNSKPRAQQIELVVELLNLEKDLPEVSGDPKAKNWIKGQIEEMRNEVPADVLETAKQEILKGAGQKISDSINDYIFINEQSELFDEKDLKKI